MIYIVNDSNDPFFNHAAEEYVIENYDDQVFMLWINRPSILIGRNQNTLSEINIDYVRKNHIDVVRRLSGGGTVYNDFGIMNFTFITYKNSDPSKDGFEKFALPVIEGLKSLGVEAQFTGRNDILIDGKKICGNAQYSRNKKILHHGTLLYDGNMTHLKGALKSKDIKFVDKSVKSVASRVTSIAKHLEEDLTVEEFRNYLIDYVINYHSIERVHEFSHEELLEIEKIADFRFRNWDWNYGKSPKSCYNNAVKFPASGVVEYNVDIEDGRIKDIALFGDFFGDCHIGELEENLLGLKFGSDSLREALDRIEISKYIRGLSSDDFIKGLMDVEI